MTTKASTPKGMRDFSPSVMFRRNYIFSVVKSAFEKYGFSPIETPAMENLETLTGKYGDEGDRLIFKVLNSGDFLSKTNCDANSTSKDLTKQISDKALRYDLTVPFARYVVQNRNDITFPFKRYQMQNVWRADRPQKGRFREFFQCDADIIGTKSLISEIELVQLSDEVFTSLNIPNIEICINNRKVLNGMVEIMGCPELFNNIVIVLDKLDRIGIDKVKEEMKSEGVSEEGILVLEKFLSYSDISELSDLLKQSEIGTQGVKELQFISENISKLGLKTLQLKFDITLARGIDYYTGCIFEVKQNDIKIGSVGGGGRYDNLTSVFGLDDVSGVGISFGIDRIYMVMEELNCFPENIDQNTRVMFANFGEKESVFCLGLLKQLRENGISSELYPTSVKMKKQMSYADKKGVEFVVMIGENEMESNTITIKNMKLGTHEESTITEFISKIK
ncbi:MAG: histidine--tRNA ligase [Flavobacteriales bacterium]|nr:histidine--tRNA ligase [Flavobacteriales bacterium]MBT7481167.1 histidine--tRNA ligase [Flavobacteriales bacterium]